MSLSTNVTNLATRVATEAKSLRVLINGNAVDLSSLTTVNKTSLMAAVNEINAALGGAGVSIDDVTAATTTVYSSTKTNSAIAAAVASLVASAPGLMDTLNELAAALGDDPNFAATITTALGLRVRADAAQAFTGPQQTQARSNIGAGTSSLTIGAGAGQVPDAAANITALAGKEPTITGGLSTDYWKGNKTFGVLDKAAVGLSAVDNTSDANKPVSTAQAAADALKAPLASPAFTGTPTGITKTHVGLNLVDNTADASKPVSTAQQTALNLKANLASPTFTGTVGGITAAMVGLGSVNNTSDANKPVSTAQAAADALAASSASVGDTAADFVATFNAGLV